MKLTNDLMMRVLRHERTDTTPIWIMRQAGRYLPEYRELRSKVSGFMELCKTPDLVAEATLQPLRRFDLDAAILFSDILVIPEAMGLGLKFIQGEGPVFEHPVRTEEEILSLPRLDVQKDLKYVLDGIQVTLRELDGRVPLIGFCGSPYTLACYMMEGKSSRHYSYIKELQYTRPELLHKLLTHISDILIDYLNAQVEAGVQILQIFDTWGGQLTTGGFSQFSLQYIERILEGIRPNSEGEKVPVICFTKDAPLSWYKMYENVGADAISIDWRHDMDTVISVVRDMTVQGNLDPMALLGSEEYITKQVHSIIDQVGNHPHIFNLGHGITPGIDPDKVKFLVDTVHAHKHSRGSK